MRISRIQAGEITVPLKVPFKTAVRTVSHVHSLIVQIQTDDERTGFGEAPATALITGDLIGSMRAAVAHLAPQLVGRDLTQFTSVVEVLQRGLVHHTSVKAALEMALWDLRAQSFGVPLYQLLGGGPSLINTDVTISLNDVETMVEDARRAVADGFDELKIKLGGRPWREDVNATIAIHQAVGDHVKLRLDANQGWTPKSAVRILNAIDAADIEIEFVEQPVKAADVAGLKYVTDRTSVPVLADESVFGVMDALHLLETQSADVINIKLMKTGGIGQASEIAHLTRRFNRRCMIGCMLESHVSVTAAAHFASAYADVVTFVDLDGPHLCAESRVAGGVEAHGPCLSLPNLPGLGISMVHDLHHVVEYR